MGNETRRPSVSSEGSLFHKGGLHLARPRIDLEEAVGGRDILCDCHCGPMYYFPVSLTATDDFVMCWVSECGRCYNKSLGYFHLRTAGPTPERINEHTRSMTLCPTENCPTHSSMAITRRDDAFSREDEACWYCFDCGTEFPRRHFNGLFERLLRIFRPSRYQILSAKHYPCSFLTHWLTIVLPSGDAHH
jgi:hypothetical protein